MPLAKIITMKRLLKWLARGVFSAALIVATIFLVRAFDSRNLPELEPWHRTMLEAEFSEADADRVRTLEDYLLLEQRLFSELRSSVYERVRSEDKGHINRYASGSLSDPDRFAQNWNRTFELRPDDLRGGVLLLHGLTDSPYSVRHLAQIFRAQGFYVLALRMPGHGTVPAALTAANWKDWMAATRLAARHVRAEVPAELPFYFGGYSNGGALAVKYTMDALQASELPVPERLFLFSPMVGVSPFARFSDWHKAISWIPYFEKFRWLDVYPEYDPFKYNSFPKAAGEQTFSLTRAIREQIDDLVATGRGSEFPPTLTFQSLVDATVLTRAIVEQLYDKLSPEGSELVLFDINRRSDVETFLQARYRATLEKLIGPEPLSYKLTLVTNSSSESPDVVARMRPPGSAEFADGIPLGLTWPRTVYSLSHVALPFPPNDAVYGAATTQSGGAELNIGTLEPRGEKNVLTVPPGLLMRLRYNPFFDYMDARIVEAIRR